MGLARRNWVRNSLVVSPYVVVANYNMSLTLLLVIICRLILLVIEAGIDIDLDMLKLIGTRGFIIATIGSFLPIGIGIVIAIAIGTDTKGALAAGAAFGPTSLGIALNILRSGGILNT